MTLRPARHAIASGDHGPANLAGAVVEGRLVAIRTKQPVMGVGAELLAALGTGALEAPGGDGGGGGDLVHD